MIHFTVTLDTGMYFPMFVFIPTGNEIIRRLSLKKEWNYIMIGRHKNVQESFVIKGDTIVENGTSIRLYKKSTEPMCEFERLGEIVDQLKLHYRNSYNTNHILIWINYNLFYKPQEPICLIFIEKRNGNWEESVKTTDSFDQIEEAMVKGDVFDTFYIVYDRFEELRQYYTW